MEVTVLGHRPFRSPIDPVQVCQSIALIEPPIRSGVLDSVYWNKTSNGIFSINSAYILLYRPGITIAVCSNNLGSQQIAFDLPHQEPSPHLSSELVFHMVIAATIMKKNNTKEDIAKNMVAQAFISGSVKILLDWITSSDLREFMGRRKLKVSVLNELETKLLALNAVLNDAEEKQITDPAVKKWLDKLKDVVLDAEDLLDEINADILRCKAEGGPQNLTTQVISFFSSP
ncbi:uncharacterized protein LOC113855342 [Abrus precatorius]|uniref:Uncharacterized protein LOC113855342 n=1 Tax=Abrus precatorius TaxID=3816 RepID=A0A8B8KG68_ABRPR|nr:uncharacterized protein LOC113855342 [Abrus precatorius]